MQYTRASSHVVAHIFAQRIHTDTRSCLRGMNINQCIARARARAMEPTHSKCAVCFIVKCLWREFRRVGTNCDRTRAPTPRRGAHHFAFAAQRVWSRASRTCRASNPNGEQRKGAQASGGMCNRAAAASLSDMRASGVVFECPSLSFGHQQRDPSSSLASSRTRSH